MAAVPRVLRRLASNRPLTAGVLALVALLSLAWIIPAFRPDPNRPDVEHGLSEMGAPLPPSLAAPLGTDDLGRDQLARVAHGARLSLTTALTATVIALALGLAVGLLAGLAGGWIDALLMGLVDLTLAVPILLLAILTAVVLRAAALDDSPISLAVVLGIFGWPPAARVVRARVQVLDSAEFVIAARALGASAGRIITRHLLPNLAGALAVVLTTTIAQVVAAEATLSFAGLGPAPPEATWGRMVYEGRIYYRSAPWLFLLPGLAIVCTVAAFYLLGAGLRRELERVEL